MKATIVLSLGFLTLAVFLGGCSGNPQARKQKYLKSGIGYLKTGKYEESIIQFQNALKLDPHYVDAFYQLAQAQFASYEWSEAYDNLQRAIHLDPARVDARLSLANLYLAARDFAKAGNESSFALKQDPNNASAHELLGISLLMLRKPDGALQEFSRVVELDPQSPSAYINIALVEIGLGRNGLAEKHFQKAVAVAPHSPQPFINLANFYRLQHQIEHAEQVLQQSVRENPDDISLYIAWADVLYSQRKTDDADAVIRVMRERPAKRVKVALAAGDFYFARQDPDRALAEYRRGLDLDSRNLEIKNHMVECYLGSGRIKEAQALNSQVLSQRPKDVYAGIAKGRILLVAGKRDEAMTEFRRLLTQAQDLPQVHYYLALAYQQNQNLQEAKAELLQTLRMAPAMLEAQQSLAELNMALGDLDGAQRQAEEIVQRNPANFAGRILLGNVYLQRGDAAKARDQFLAARQISPAEPAAALSLARAFVAQQKWVESEGAFNDTLALDPHSTQALDGLVSMSVKRQQPAKALARVEQYIAKFPDDAGGHLILGSLRADARQYDLAKSELAHAIQLAPTLVMARIRLGDVNQTLGNLPAAIEEYEAVSTLQPKSAAIHTVLGDLYLRQRNTERAQKHYEQALVADPNFVLAANNLAWLHAQNGGNLDIALGLAQRAKQIQPDFVNTTDTLGWIEFKKGLYPGAVQLFQECVGKAPSSAVYRFHLGMALLATGDKQKGKAQLQAALQMKLTAENTATARQALNQID